MKSTMRILSGIQPSGILHIGNYFGMMRPAIALQEEGEALYFIADYHALTSIRDPAILRENSRRVALDFLACGLNPDKAALFRQSDVPRVTELACILWTVTPVSRFDAGGRAQGSGQVDHCATLRAGRFQRGGRRDAGAV